MVNNQVGARSGILKVITSPLGFFVLALLIAETMITIVLVGSNLEQSQKFYGLLLGVSMFVLVVILVTLLVWFKPENLIFDRDAHLIDRGKIPYGSEGHPLKAAELESLSTKAAKSEHHHA
jgi:hypothetical protein